MSSKCQNTEAISSESIKQISSNIKSLEKQQKDLEMGFKDNVQNYEELFNSTKNLMEKIEANSVPLHRQFSNEFQKNESDIDKTKENYSVLKNELQDLLKDFHKELDNIKKKKI